MIKLNYIPILCMCGLALLPCQELKAQSSLVIPYTYNLYAGANDQKVPGTASSVGAWGKTYATDDFSGYGPINHGTSTVTIHAKGTVHASASPGYGDYRNGGKSELSIVYKYTGDVDTTCELSYMLTTGGQPVAPADCGGQLICSILNTGMPVYRGGGNIDAPIFSGEVIAIDINVHCHPVERKDAC